MKIVVYTLGCKVNAVESRSIIRQLESLGAEVTDEIGFADAYVINTCTVTAEADRKCRQTIGKFLKCNPKARVYVIGCSSERDPTQYEKYDNVVYICGNQGKTKIIDTIMSDIIVENRVNVLPISSIYEDMPIPKHNKTRDFIKVQDGCNNFCSYCMIPFVRGRERSRDVPSILSEVETAARRCGEIVITGINVSSFGRDTGTTLAELFTKLKNIPIRKRLSSLECNIVDDALLSAMADSGFCDHFHLSLQSGSDSVLKSMNRHYTTAEYLKKVQLIRQYFPNAGITTDVITGFPTENEDAFLETLDFAREVGYSDMHIFPYSERKGTKAAAMSQVPVETRRARAARLALVANELKTEFLKKQIGQTLSVYVEEDGEGYSTNYVRVYTDMPEGNIVDIKISDLYKKGVK